jgi:cytochrome bd-type quinol oxidase subunit 2
MLLDIYLSGCIVVSLYILAGETMLLIKNEDNYRKDYWKKLDSAVITALILCILLWPIVVPVAIYYMIFK